MKVILTGATGFIGGEVLSQCLASPTITEVVVLSRRSLADQLSAPNPKLNIIIHKDFSEYPDEVLKALAGANACIWCLGAIKFEDSERAREVSVDWTCAAMDAFAEHLAPRVPEGEQFRFIYLGGALSEQNQDKKLWFLSDIRSIRGQAETSVIEAGKRQQGLETFVTKPGYVLAKGTFDVMKMLNMSIKVDVLAACLISLAERGHSFHTLENNELRIRGTGVLKGQKHT